jgi:ABC-type sugar transport system substrate-binding protein
VLEAVRDGEMLFAIDQQQYLQGYLPVMILVKYAETRRCRAAARSSAPDRAS